MFVRSPNRDFKKAGKKIFKALSQKAETRLDQSWDSLLSINNKSGDAVMSQEELDRHRSTVQDHAELDNEDQSKRVIAQSLSYLYGRNIRPAGKDYQVCPRLQVSLSMSVTCYALDHNRGCLRRRGYRRRPQQ